VLARIGLLRIGVLVVVVAAVIIGILFRDRLSGSAGDLQVGDCFEVPAADEVEDVQHRPCSEPHDGEVFLVRDYSGGDTYPTDDQFIDWVARECVDGAFATYTGQDYDVQQTIDVGFFYPQSEGWGKGDREVTCYLTPLDGLKVTVSYKAGAAPS
jgi:Septum formation